MRIVYLLIVLGFPLLDLYATMRVARWSNVPVWAWERPRWLATRMRLPAAPSMRSLALSGFQPGASRYRPYTQPFLTQFLQLEQFLFLSFHDFLITGIK